MNTKDYMSEEAIIYRDVYGRGHGKETTIRRYIDVLGMTREKAEETFATLSEGAHS